MPPEQVDLIAVAGLIVTMDAGRSLISDGAIAVHHGRIVAVGGRADVTSRYEAGRIIGGPDFIILPGFIDGHSHAGHGLVRTMGGDDFPAFREACRKVYMEAASLEFWAAEARLSALERIKAGVTTAALYLGGGDENNRSDSPEIAQTYAKNFTGTGPNLILGIGPSRPPFPRSYVHYINGRPITVTADFKLMLEVIAEVADTVPSRKAQVAFTTPIVNPVIHSDEHLGTITEMAQTMKAFARSRNAMLMVDGHRTGTVAHAAKVLGILDDKTLLSHAIGLTEEEIEIVAERRSVVSNNAISASGIWDRCPVPELLAAGARVILSSDGLAPDGGSDMFDVMRGAMRYHRVAARNPNILPPGRALAMTTIDAATAFGIGDEVGSAEHGKRADLVLIDTRKPHLQPASMPLHQLLMYANAADVHTVLLNGEVVVESGKVNCEAEILGEAQEQSKMMLARAGLGQALQVAPDFWADSYDRPIRDGINHHQGRAT